MDSQMDWGRFRSNSLCCRNILIQVKSAQNRPEKMKKNICSRVLKSLRWLCGVARTMRFARLTASYEKLRLCVSAVKFLLG
jgi:hypothetical protein